MAIKLIAFDLDGTLLDERKRLSEENRRALLYAAEKGALLVPATGRIYEGIPEFLKELPGCRYFITINGAMVYDGLEERRLYSAELSVELCSRLMDYMDRLPVIYDCYQDDWGFMGQEMYEQIEDYVPDAGIVELFHRLRTRVPELREMLLKKGRPVQKMQMHFKDMALREHILEKMPGLFPEVNVSSSLAWNIELNSAGASKGQALRALCRELGIDLKACMAFGDGSNDRDMLETAGIGVAMENAVETVKAAADWLAPSNVENGVAAGIYRYI